MQDSVDMPEAVKPSDSEAAPAVNDGVDSYVPFLFQAANNLLL